MVNDKLKNMDNNSQFTTHNSPLVKDGYKNTEIGVIPEEWEVDVIDNVLKISTGSKNTQDKLKDGKYPFFVRSQTIERINTYSYDCEAVLTAGDGVGTGKIFHYLINEKFELHQRVYIMNGFKTKLNGLFFFLYFSNHFYNRVMQMTAKSSVDSVRREMIAEMKIPLPPLPEQTAIATVLSDTDNLLQALQKKIAKKQAIKKGAMQELLKPKEGWVQEILPKVCWYQEGPGLRNWQFTKKGMKVINVTNLVNGYLNLDKTDRHISMQEFEKMYKHFEIDDKDIVMASSGNSYSKVAVVRKQDLRLLMNTSVIRFKPMNGLDYNYLLIFLKSNLFKDQIDLLITGGAQPNFGPAHLKKIKIPLPPTKEEQTKIATILSDMNIEIETLERQMAKYKQVKQGLMQNLLTGKIRIVNGK